MFFKSRFYLRDREGETRVRRKFLFFPKTFERKRTRWLCYANIIEKVMPLDIGGTMVWGAYEWKWVPIDFEDDIDR